MIKQAVIGLCACTLFILGSAAPAHALNVIDDTTGPDGAGCYGTAPEGVAGFLGFKSWDAFLCKDKYGVPQFYDVGDVWKVALAVVDFMARVSGYLAVGFIIWGGVKYLKSQGEPSETGAARQIITNAIMGLVICILSVALVQFIAGAF